MGGWGSVNTSSGQNDTLKAIHDLAGWAPRPRRLLYVMRRSNPFLFDDLACLFLLLLTPEATSLHILAPPPITLIGGFLGAGKTSAVTSMLTSRDGLKIAVLVNDLASVNVDAGTLRRASATEDGVTTIELQNGCVCCGACGADLAPILRRLSQRSQGFDHLVVELSGVAVGLRSVRASTV